MFYSSNLTRNVGETILDRKNTKKPVERFNANTWYARKYYLDADLRCIRKRTMNKWNSSSKLLRVRG